MLLRQIRYFQAVVRLNSFTKAAEECHISQSAVSQQIQALEQELGVKLMVREKRSFTLTPSGELFYRKSLVLTADLERLVHDVVRLAHQDEAGLGIGYPRNYGGREFELAVAEFTERHPEVPIRVIRGNHEDLYDALRTGEADIVLNDQRRAFSDRYVNLTLSEQPCYVEIAARNPIAQLNRVTAEELKNTPCILVASSEQEEQERSYYRDIIGFQGEFLFAENLDQARLMVVGNRGFLPVEGGSEPEHLGGAIRRVELHRNGQQMKRPYCAFWLVENSGYFVEEFGEILREQFAR